MRDPWRSSRRFKLVLGVLALAVATVVTGASAADFEIDDGPCRETPGEPLLLRCPTAYVGAEYELEIESEEGSGCTSAGNPYIWYEIVNSSLPPGLTMSRSGVISGTPTRAGFTRFWVWNHDLTQAQGGPDWCQREDRSEREFSIYVDPGLEIDNESVPAATLGQPYSETLTATQVTSLDPRVGAPAQAAWSLASGSLPPGITLSQQGVLSGTPTNEGGYGFAVRAQNGALSETQQFGISVRQPMSVRSPFAPTVRPIAEVGIRYLAAASATGGSGTYEWSIGAGELPVGLTLDKTKGTVSGTPQRAGSFTFSLVAADEDGRVATAPSRITVAPRLALKRSKLKPATAGAVYRAKLAVSGGVRPMKWIVARGKLPAGVRLSSSLGALAGRPKSVGTYSVTVEVRDALGATATQRLVLEVKP